MDLDDDFDNFSDSNLIIVAVKYKVSNEVTDEVTGMSYEVCDIELTPYNCYNYNDLYKIDLYLYDKDLSSFSFDL